MLRSLQGIVDAMSVRGAPKTPCTFQATNDAVETSQKATETVPAWVCEAKSTPQAKRLCIASKTAQGRGLSNSGCWHRNSRWGVLGCLPFQPHALGTSFSLFFRRAVLAGTPTSTACR